MCVYRRKQARGHRKNHIQAKETGLGRGQPSQHLNLGLPATRTAVKPPSCGVLLWQLLQRDPPFSGCRHRGRQNQSMQEGHPKHGTRIREMSPQMQWCEERVSIELPIQSIRVIEINPKYPVWSLCESVAPRGEEIQTVDEGFNFDLRKSSDFTTIYLSGRTKYSVKWQFRNSDENFLRKQTDTSSDISKQMNKFKMEMNRIKS